MSGYTSLPLLRSIGNSGSTSSSNSNNNFCSKWSPAFPPSYIKNIITQLAILSFSVSFLFYSHKVPLKYRNIKFMSVIDVPECLDILLV